MPIVGITGHVQLPEELTPLLIRELTARLRIAVAMGYHGITCLAQGADQLFAGAMTSAGGRYDVILPATDYGGRQRIAGHAQPFRRLLNDAAGVQVMPFRTSSRAAYLAASEAMLDRCDLLLAVWNGRPSQAVGDTADVVARARARGLDVEIVWLPADSVPRAQAAATTGSSPVTSQRRASS